MKLVSNSIIFKKTAHHFKFGYIMWSLCLVEKSTNFYSEMISEIVWIYAV
jgi:hypothetical protein